MLINRKSILCYAIFQTIVCITYETPVGKENEIHEEVDESDIEKGIAKKEEKENKETEKAKEEELEENKKQETGNSTYDENTLDKIKYLEKEKRELYEQISKSIDESVILLEHTNDTEAQIGIDFMKNLKDQLKKINGSDLGQENKEEYIQRRSRAGDTRSHHAKKKVKITYQEISDLFKGKGANSKKLQEINDIGMHKKIDEWILQRQIEKKKILEYKSKWKHVKQEKCPRMGNDKKIIKVNGQKRKRYLPCCRKCCKKSYMGCL